MHVPERFREVARGDLLEGKLITEVTLDYLKNFWKAYDAGIAPVFFGSPGTGKTTAASYIARHAWEVGQVDTEFVVVPDLLTQVDLSRFSEATQAVVWRMKTAPLLVLDDAHAVAANTAAANVLSSVVSVRWNSRRPTLWTGNFDLLEGNEWAGIYAHFGPVLGRRIEDGSAGYRVLVR